MKTPAGRAPVGRPPLEARADLATIEPYVSPQLQARFRMNTNESPYPPPRDLMEDVARQVAASELNRYPDRDADRLFETLARHTGRSPESIWVANGSNEVFLHLFLAFGGGDRKALLFTPTYSLHVLIPRITGTQVIEESRDEDFLIDVERAATTIRRERPEVVIVCSPNNPTGLIEPRPTIVDLVREAPGLVVVDEAYGEFSATGASVIDLLDEHENLVVVKTLSKAWRLAGLRVGYMIASSTVVNELYRVRLPYHLSTFSQLAACAVLDRSEDALEHVEAVKTERDRISVGLQALGLRTYPSQANFVLFDVEDARSFWEALLTRGVLVRSYEDVPGLEGRLRVTAGLPEETDAFLGAMREVLE
jgi:histidinol-phosphate aminotransferase